MSSDRHPDPAIPDQRLEPLRRALADRDAAAFVHAGAAEAPSIRYCRSSAAAGSADPAASTGAGTNGSTEVEPLEPTGFDGDEPRLRADGYAIAVTAEEVLSCDSETGTSPAEALASRLAERGLSGTILAPPTIPHDAALYLERAGFELASSDAIERARARKTPAERSRIDRAQVAAGAGFRRAAAVLADAAVVDDRLAVDDDPLTPERLRRAADAAIVTEGAFPCGNTSVRSPGGSAPFGRGGRVEPLRPGEPIVLELAPRDAAGYHGRVVRTLVVGSDGGWERRAQVAIESAFRSVATMLGADDSTVAAVEGELVAEVRSFGFGEEVSARVRGVGLEPVERPSGPGDPIDDGTVVCVEAAVATEDGAGAVRFGDLLERRDGTGRWLSRPSRSFDPATVASEPVASE